MTTLTLAASPARIRAFVLCLLALTLCPPAPLSAAEPEEFALENGARVILAPVPGAGCVSVIAHYETGGFLSEPEGMPQAAHLAEHLRCTAATASHPQGESFARLNRGGSANAETLCDFTYYDYVVTPDQLALVLDVERERLGSLRVTRADVQREGPRAAAEVNAVARAPGAPVGKFAQMALAQAWRHGAAHADVRTGLGQLDHAALRDLTRDTHTPGGLTLMIAGEFDPADARKMLEDTLGRLAPRAAPALQPATLKSHPQRHEMTWDVDTRVVSIACPTPEDETARAALTLAGGLVVMRARGIEGVLSSVGTTVMSPAGVAPFHIAVAIEDDADADAIARAVHDLLGTAAELAPSVRAQAGFLRTPPPIPTAEAVRVGGERFARMRGMRDHVARGVMLGNAGLQRLIRTRALPQASADALTALTDEQLAEMLAEATAEDTRRVTFLMPREADDERAAPGP